MPRVLVVDDDPNTVEMLSKALSLFGHQPERAFSGEEALDQVSERLPDVVLLDLMMPGIDGYETLRRLRGLPGGSQVPVIVVTASSEPDLEQRVAAAGATGCLRKPVQLSVLADLIDSCLALGVVRDPTSTAR
jgi:CheY-like chemotaxis protein